MKKQVNYLLQIGLLLLFALSFSQDPAVSEKAVEAPDLFDSEEILPIKLSYSVREVKNKTNDSTYIFTDLAYQLPDGQWRNIEVRLRARGHNRRETCYFSPIKVRISKAERMGTIFEDHKKLKLVLPCLIQEEKNDKLLKEYLAYKMYEEIGTHHYKNRLLEIDFTDVKPKKSKKYQLKGFLQEDIDKVAERAGGMELKDRKVHPLQQDDHASIQNDIFQYMIGNTDYSIAYQHNEKLIFTGDKKTVPVPYDFDLCGLVNASYAVVSQVGNQKLPITSVTERLYRGYQRNTYTLQEVRKEYLSKKDAVYQEIDKVKDHFDDIHEYRMAQDFMDGFYSIIADDSRFEREIANRARTK